MMSLRAADCTGNPAGKRAHAWAMPGRPGYYTVKSATDASEK